MVLECVNRLLEKGYKPKDIELENTWKLGHKEKGRLDILVKKEGKAFLMIECKLWGKEFEKELQNMKKDGGQLFGYFQQDKSADYLMLYASQFSAEKVQYRNEIIKIEDSYRETPNVKDLHECWNKLTKNNGFFENDMIAYHFQSNAIVNIFGEGGLKEIKHADSNYIFIQFLEIVKRNVVSDIKKGTSITSEKVKKGKIPVLAGGKKTAYFHNESNRDGNIITVSASGAYSGFVNYFIEPIFASDLNTIQSKDETKISTKLIFEFFKSIQKEIYTLQRGQSQPHVCGGDLEKIKIPLPPKDIQQRIVDEIQVLETDEENFRGKIANLEKKIDEIMNGVEGKKERIENLEKLLKRGKSTKHGVSKVQIIKSGQSRGFRNFDFSEKHFVDEKFILDERKLKKGDILINSTGVGTAGRVTQFDLEGDFVVDSYITIFRVNREKVLPNYALHSLCNIGFKNIEKMATGQSGQIELSLGIIGNIKIPLPPLAEQEKNVTKIEKIETEIAALKNSLAEIPKKKEVVLKKYL